MPIKKIRFGNFMVHLEVYSKRRIDFEVYPILDVENPDGTKFISYIQKDTGCDLPGSFNTEKAKKRFDGSFEWRGIWEGRLYFTDDEYWGEELGEMHELYENHIVPWCKDFIKRHNDGPLA